MSIELKKLFDNFYLDDDHLKRTHMAQLQKEFRKISPKTNQGQINHFLHSDMLQEHLVRQLLDRVDALDNAICLNIRHTVINDEVTNGFCRMCIDHTTCSIPDIDNYILAQNSFESIIKQALIDLWIETNQCTPEDIDIRYLYFTLKSKNDILSFTRANMQDLVTNFQLEENTLRIHQTLLNQSATESTPEEFSELTKTNEDNVVIFKHYREYYDRTPSFEEVEYVKNKLEDKSTLVDIIVNHKNLLKSCHISNLNEAFYTVFERDITIFELQKHYETSLEWNTVAKDAFITYFSSVKERFEKAVITTIHLYKMYTREVINELFAIKYHIDCFDKEDFEDVLKRHLAKTPLYQRHMLEKIKILHNKNFSTDVSESDLNYYYDEISQKNLHLESDDLVTFLTSMYNQTQKLTQDINTVFQNILRRDADVFELVAYIKKLRQVTWNESDSVISLDDTNKDNNETVLMELEDELFASLEYIHILKSKVTAVNDKLYPSQLNAILHSIMSSKDSNNIKRDVETLKKYVLNFGDIRFV